MSYNMKNKIGKHLQEKKLWYMFVAVAAMQLKT